MSTPRATNAPSGAVNADGNVDGLNAAFEVSMMKLTSPSDHRHRGVGMALAAAVLFGASAPLAKLLVAGTAPQLLAGLLYLGSGVGLGALWLRRRRSAEVARETPLMRRDIRWLAGAIVFGGGSGRCC